MGYRTIRGKLKKMGAEEQHWDRTTVLMVQCIGCKTERDIDYAESEKISLSGGVPMCVNCGMPMIAKSAHSRL